MKQAAILLSRQALHPTGNVNWVKQVGKAVTHIALNGFSLIASVGVPTYELTLTVGSKAKLPLTVVIPEGAGFSKETILREFALDASKTQFCMLDKKTGAKKSERLLSRDKDIIKKTDVLYPISIRSGGNMEDLIEQAEQSGKTIDRQFQIPYEVKKEKIAYKIALEELNPSLLSLPDDYIYHWTRTAKSKWPDERLYDFYNAILSSDQFARSAFATLKNILSSKRIIASCRHMPKGCRTVSFTGLHPTQVVALMRWRSRYREMSFEPYGIGIKKDVATTSGLEKVIYYDSHSERQFDSHNRWKYQSIGRHTDWRTEKEFRIPTDFDFNDIHKDDLIVLTRWSGEAIEIQRKFGYQTISMIQST